MEILMPFLLILILGGFFLYNPMRRKYSGVIGVLGSYLVSIGLILAVSLIGAIFSADIRGSMDGGIIGLLVYIVLALLAIAYVAFLMMTRCTTVMERVLLPFAIMIIAFGFATRLMASIFLHIPMESGDSDAGRSGYSFPQYIYDGNGNPWELMNSGWDNANYYCQKTGETRMFYESDFDMGAPSGFSRR